MPIYMWIVWAIMLVVQNFSFTFVSRARNSGSLRRHFVAAIMSNGVWFFNQILIFSEFARIVLGKQGIGPALFAGVFYTVFTLIGSLWAHKFSLNTEKGKGAVGANAKYVQITVGDWAGLQSRLSHAEEILGVAGA